MAKPYIITSLDIGSDSFKMLSVLRKPKEDDFEVLSFQKADSFGVRKGVVVDFRKAGEIIVDLARKTTEDLGRKIGGLYVNIGGGHIFSESSRGLVSVSRADRKISEEDINRAIQAAQTFSLSSNMEIIETFPKEFIIDGKGGIKEAVGLEGVRLEVEALNICGFSPYLRNSRQAVAHSGLQLNYLIPSPLAGSSSVLDTREKELGVCLLDIGAGTTSMSVFEEGNLIHLAIFPIGSAHITSDIAICLKTDIDTAEQIKIEFGNVKGSRFLKKKNSKNSKKIKIKSLQKSVNRNENENENENEEKASLVFSQKTLNDIINARISEIFNLTNKELKKIFKQGQLPAGVVLTGGGAKISGIKELAKEELKLPSRIGGPYAFSSLSDEPDLSVLCGLALEGAFLEESRNDFSFNKGGFGSVLKKIINIFMP